MSDAQIRKVITYCKMRTQLFSKEISALLVVFGLELEEKDQMLIPIVVVTILTFIAGLLLAVALTTLKKPKVEKKRKKVPTKEVTNNIPIKQQSVQFAKEEEPVVKKDVADDPIVEIKSETTESPAKTVALSTEFDTTEFIARFHKSGFVVKKIKDGLVKLRCISLNANAEFCLYKNISKSNVLNANQGTPYYKVSIADVVDCFHCDGSKPPAFIVEFKKKTMQFSMNSILDMTYIVRGLRALLQKLKQDSAFLGTVKAQLRTKPSTPKQSSPRSGGGAATPNGAATPRTAAMPMPSPSKPLTSATSPATPAVSTESINSLPNTTSSSGPSNTLSATAPGNNTLNNPGNNGLSSTQNSSTPAATTEENGQDTAISDTNNEKPTEDAAATPNKQVKPRSKSPLKRLLSKMRP